MDPQLKRLQDEIASAVAGLSAEQWERHAPGKWCAGEVLEHLYLTYTGTTKGFSRVIEAGKLSTTSASWKQRWRKLVVVGWDICRRAGNRRRWRSRRDCRGRKCRRKSRDGSPRWIN